MKLVVDANVLFAALIKSSTTLEMLFEEKLTLYAPEFIIEEFDKYKAMIMEKSQRTEKEVERAMEIIKKK